MTLAGVTPRLFSRSFRPVIDDVQVQKAIQVEVDPGGAHAGPSPVEAEDGGGGEAAAAVADHQEVGRVEPGERDVQETVTVDVRPGRAAAGSGVGDRPDGDVGEIRRPSLRSIWSASSSLTTCMSRSPSLSISTMLTAAPGGVAQRAGGRGGERSVAVLAGEGDGAVLGDGGSRGVGRGGPVGDVFPGDGVGARPGD